MKVAGAKPLHIVRNHVRTKNVLTNIGTYLADKKNNNLLISGFRSLRLEYGESGCRILSNNRSRSFEFANWTRAIDQHGRIFAGVIDSEIDITGDESVDELRVFSSPDGKALQTLEASVVNFEERPGPVRAIVLMTGFKIPGLSIYCFDFSPQFLSVTPGSASRALHATESWRDVIFSPKFGAEIEAVVGSYSLFTRAQEIKIQLYTPELSDQIPDLDRLLQVETPSPYQLNRGVLTVGVGQGPRIQPLRFSLPGDVYLRDEPLSYEYSVYQLGAEK